MNGESTDLTEKRMRRRGFLIRLMLFVFVPYATIAAMLAFFQRKLIYLPTREAVSASDAGFSNGQLHHVEVKVDEGLDLQGWLVLAEGSSSESNDLENSLRTDQRRLILYFAGNGGHRGYRLKEIRQFTGLGNHVLYVDYRGYAENRGSPTEIDLVRDARHIWDFATVDLGVPPERVILWGESLGGGVAIQLAANLCDEGTIPGGLMLRGTFTALTDAAAYHYPWLPVRWLLLDRYPSIDRIPDVASPLLVIHGRRDRVVPFEQGERLFAAAPDESHNGVAKMFVELPEAGHNDVMYVAADEVETAVATFLDNLPD
ncbi:MAG: alpha/beta hydrolase [Planctomycetota bacterium]|nr:MAG: alpha/beta hydrolase [Planctomycetota bacterium]